MSNIQDTLIRKYADLAAAIVARKTVLAFQQIKTTLSGDDSCLTNAWDDVCIQVQGEDSVFEDIYDETLRNCARIEVQKLKCHDLQSLWLQTEAGMDWHCCIENPTEDDRFANSNLDPQVIPYDVDHIVGLILEEYVYPRAGVYTNKRIRAFLDENERNLYEMD